MRGRILVAALSLLFTYLFFAEYLPPLRLVHIPYDLQDFHYPLVAYAFQAVRQGRFPAWDPTMYCGMPFAANVQVGFFYPPNWLLLLLAPGHKRLSYSALEALMFAHLWLAFYFAYRWLRGKQLDLWPALFGAGVFAYSGYPLTQIQHQGLIEAYPWFPLGLMAIDDAVRSHRWQPLWKLAAASALCLLAGYPPLWIVFCVFMTVYALAGPWRWRAAAGAVAALAFSLLLAAPQVLPAQEAAALKVPEPKYGGGLRNPLLYLCFLAPNYFDFNPTETTPARIPGDYLYLGAPGLFGIAQFLRFRGWRGQGPVLAAGAVSLILLTNPFGIIGRLLEPFSLLVEIVRDYYFMAGLLPVAAMATAVGLQAYGKQTAQPQPRWTTPVITAGLAVWAAVLFWIWLPGAPEFASGWRTCIYPAIMLALFALGLIAWRGSDGTRRVLLGVALLLAVAVDYKAFGTSRVFDSRLGNLNKIMPLDPSFGLEAVGHPVAYRIARDPTGPFPPNLRHYGLTTPQGFDPLLPAQYKKYIEGFLKFDTDRTFHLDPRQHELLRRLSVRYFVASEIGSDLPAILADPQYRLLEPSQGFYKVFELSAAQPAYRWQGAATASIERVTWEPERREFLVRAPSAGRLILVEQFYPGWQAWVDGQPVAIERWEEVFQAVAVPAGERRVRFQYHSRRLLPGLLIGAIALAALVLVARKRS